MHEHKSPAYALHAQELANLIAKASQGMQPRSCSHFASTPLDNAHVNESIGETQQLLQEMVAHLSSDAKMDARKAVAKLSGRVEPTLGRRGDRNATLLHRL